MEGFNGAQTRDRALYNDIRNKIPGVKAYKSYLRQDLVIKNNQTAYSFDLLRKEGVGLPQRLLGQQDVFFANLIALYLCVEEKTKPGSGRLITYPNLVELSEAGLTDAQDLEAFYAGTLSINVNTNDYVREMDTRRFRKVGGLIAQPFAQTGAIASKLAGDASEQDYLSGMEEMEPYVVLSGQRQTRVTIQIPSFDGTPAWASANGTHDVKLVLYAAGFEVPGIGLNFTAV